VYSETLLWTSMFNFRLDTFNNKQPCFTFLYIYICIYIQETKKHNNTGSHKQGNPIQFYFPIDLVIIFRYHYMLSDFISYAFVIFSVPKDIKISF